LQTGSIDENVPPGQEVKANVLLNRLYDLTKTGVYSITASRLALNRDVLVTSNTVELKVTEPINDSLTERIALMESLSQSERNRILSDVQADRKEMQAALIDLLDSNDQKVRCYAAFLLGSQGMSEAVLPLSDAITLEWQPVTTMRLWHWGKYPAAEALIKIGNVSVINTMVENLSTTEDAKARELSLLVLKNILGKELAEYKLRRIIQQSEGNKKTHLQDALRDLQKATS
jgi:HEAT repeat protein